MSDENFLNSLRKSINLKTPAEKQAEADDKARIAQAEADDQPRRQALQQEFRSKVDPVVNAVLGDVNIVAGEAHLQIIEFKIQHASGPMQHLYQRRFQLSRQLIGNQNPASSQISVPTLDLGLDLSGNVIIQGISKPDKFPLASIEADGVELKLRLQKAFGDYLSESVTKLK